jgi:hypothetical protein
MVHTQPTIERSRRRQGCCFDCGRRYGDEYGFPDLTLPNEVWKHIAPLDNDEGGLLCPSCICRRVYLAGIETKAVFTSGPITSVETIAALYESKGESQ